MFFVVHALKVVGREVIVEQCDYQRLSRLSLLTSGLAISANRSARRMLAKTSGPPTFVDEGRIANRLAQIAEPDVE